MYLSQHARIQFKLKSAAPQWVGNFVTRQGHVEVTWYDKVSLTAKLAHKPLFFIKVWTSYQHMTWLEYYQLPSYIANYMYKQPVRALQ